MLCRYVGCHRVYLCKRTWLAIKPKALQSARLNAIKCAVHEITIDRIESKQKLPYERMVTLGWLRSIASHCLVIRFCLIFSLVSCARLHHRFILKTQTDNLTRLTKNFYSFFMFLNKLFIIVNASVWWVMYDGRMGDVDDGRCEHQARISGNNEPRLKKPRCWRKSSSHTHTHGSFSTFPTWMRNVARQSNDVPEYV